MTPTAAGTRIALYYAAVFAAIGIHMPFWPLWLAHKGLTPAQIGWLVAATYLCKVVINPLVGHAVDRRGDRRRPMVLLAAASTLAWAGYAFVDGFWGILAVTIVAVGLWAAILPVGESLAMMTVSRHRLDYGRVRLWGSLSFILTATLMGRLLVDSDPDLVMWVLTGTLAATALACLGLPDQRSEAPSHDAPSVLPLVTNPAFLLFLAAASLNTAGHTVYYAFATIHWKAAGISDATIGLLWSEGVLAEIVLFAFSGPVLARLGPARLLLVAAVAGLARWVMLGLFTDIPALAVAQLLHAATFGCAHLGAMHFMQRAVPSGLSARAQGLYSAVAMGLAPGLMSPVTGVLYQELGGTAFLLMTAFALASALAAWILSRRWAGEMVSAPA